MTTTYQDGTIRKTDSGRFEVISHPFVNPGEGYRFPTFKTQRAARGFIDRNPREAPEDNPCSRGEHDAWDGISGRWCIRCNTGLPR